MMNIYLLVPRFHTNLDPIVTEFLNLGDQVFVYTLNQSIAEIRRPHVNLKFFDVNMPLLQKNMIGEIVCMSKLLKNSIDREKPDIVFARCEISRAGAVALISVILLGLRRKTVLFTQYPKLRPKFHQHLWKFFVEHLLLIRYFTQVFVKSDSVFKRFNHIDDYVEDLRSFLKSNPSYIPLAMPEIDSEEFQHKSKSDWPQSDNSFVTIAKCEPRKGIEELIEVFEDVNRQLNNEWQLRIVLQVLHTGHESYLEYLDKKYKLSQSSSIHYVMNLNVSQARDMIRNSGIFVLNSIKEPASFSHLEALALGVPIIINRDNGSSSLLPDEYGVKKTLDSMELRKAMLDFAVDLSRRKEEISVLRNQLQTCIGSNTIAKKWLSCARETNAE